MPAPFMKFVDDSTFSIGISTPLSMNSGESGSGVLEGLQIDLRTEPQAYVWNMSQLQLDEYSILEDSEQVETRFSIKPLN